MAKTDNIFTGIVRKKVGSLVGYRLTDSNNREKQGLRAYVANPSNPQTYAQARQRAKIAPAHAFFSAFEGALNHAFVPDGKVSANRNAFLSYAMSMDAVPHLKKGESGIPFLPYRISQGKNNLDNFCVCPWSDGIVDDSQLPGWSEGNLMAKYVCFNLPAVGEPGLSDTRSVADFSRLLFKNGYPFEEGDQLSFLVLIDNAGTIVPFKFEFVVDTSDISPLADVISAQSNGFVSYVEGGEQFFYLQAVKGDGFVAAGCIITRNNGTTFVYSNSWMYVTGYGRSKWAYDEQDVIESYMSKASLASSDKFLQQAKRIVSDGGEVTIDGRSSLAIRLAAGVTGTLSAQEAATVTYSNGHSKLVCIDSSPTTYNSSTGQYTKITLTPAGGEAAPLVLAQTWWGANADFVTPDEITL